MLKGLALICILLSLAIFSAGHQQNPRHQQEGPTQSPAKAAILSNEPKTEQQAPQCKSKMQWVYELISWPNGITTIAVILTLGAVVWQSSETRKAAEAALKQSRHIVASERAWLTVDVRQPSIDEILHSGARHEAWCLYLGVIVSNRGKTPARVIDVSFDFYSEAAGSSTTGHVVPGLPANRENMLRGGPITGVTLGSLYLPGQEFTLESAVSRKVLLSQEELWRNKTKVPVLYGLVKYRDAFEEDRVTRFCYAYQIEPGVPVFNANTGTPMLPSGFYKVPNVGYNEAT